MSQAHSVDDDGFDPFELFDRATGADECRDPYPEFARRRRRGAIQEVNVAGMLGDAVKQMSDLPVVYEALTYRSVSAVLRAGRTFSSGGYKDSIGLVMGPTILVMDEPEHGRYRSLIQMAFSEKALARWKEQLVDPIIHGLIDRFADRGRADLVRELTFPFPIHVIAGMLGLPREDLDRFHRWAVGLVCIAFDWERGLDASRKLGDYLLPIIAQRRREPRDDLISHLVQAEVDGDTLDDDHVLGFLRLLLPAGAETTYRSTSNLLFGLLTHPDQHQALRADRSLLPQAIEEGLRWEAPLTGIGRKCVADTEVEGFEIPAGAMMQVNLGSANRDETRWDRPDEFDIFRPPRQHMAFAFGPHRCLGMHLARLETVAVLEALFDRLPGLRLDPDASDVHITGRTFRSPRSLPIRFD